jgi:hypothetical protein
MWMGGGSCFGMGHGERLPLDRGQDTETERSFIHMYMLELVFVFISVS